MCIQEEDVAANVLPGGWQDQGDAGAVDPAPIATDKLPSPVADRDLEDLVAAQDAWTMTRYCLILSVFLRY